MKKKIIPFFIAALVFIMFLPITAQAEERLKNGLLIVQTTDKEQYSKGENIKTTLTVTNTNTHNSDVLDVNLVNLAPEGYQIMKNESSQKDISTLKAGEQVSLTTVFELKAGENTNPPKTGDKGLVGFIIVGGIAAFCLIMIALMIIGKKKRKTKGIFFSSLLVIGISTMLLGGTVTTKAETKGQISVTTFVSVDGKELPVESTVSYGKRTGLLGSSESENDVGYYVVSIWNITHQEDDTDIVTFGPAVDTDYKRAVENATELEASWSEIQQAAANGTAYTKYAKALREGHVKKIEITGNDFFSPSGTFTAFYLSIPEKYRRWNSSYNGEGVLNYANSRIRSTLNGVNNSWGRVYVGECAGKECLAASESLLSCFPAELQEIISPRTFEVPRTWLPINPYEIIISDMVTDKLWLPSASELYEYKEEKAEYHDYGSPFQKNGGQLHVPISLYREDKSPVQCWLRSPDRTSNNYIAINRKEGAGLDSYLCTSTSNAIAPFFNIDGSVEN